MKKKKVFLIIASIVIIVFVCVVFFIVKDHRENLKINEINQLEVYSAMGKDSSIFHIRYPYKFYTIDGYEGRCRSYDLQNSILREEISEEEFKYFVEYVTNLEKEYPTEDAVVAYRINFIYYDEKGEEHQEVITGYDDFPEDWGTFIEHVNTICGYNYLSTTGDIVKLTPDFLMKRFNVRDSDVREGTLADVIEDNQLDLFDVSDYGFDINEEFDKYYAGLKENQIEPYRPVELYSVDSTQEEYDAFIKEYLNAIGGQWQERESDQEYLRYFYSTTDDRYFYIGRSADLSQMNVDDRYEYYCLALDLHMENMAYKADFYYSANYKYILVDATDTDMTLAFAGVEAD